MMLAATCHLSFPVFHVLPVVIIAFNFIFHFIGNNNVFNY